MIDDEEMKRRAVAAYRCLLAIPLGSLARLNADQAMALLRDIIAELDGEDAETIQSMYEAESYLRSTPRSG